MIPLALVSFHQTKDAKSQGKDLAMRNLSQFIPTSSCVGVTAPRISLLCPSGTIYAIFFCYSELYTHKQMYLNKYGCITYKMYKEAENDLAVKFYHMSSQCKTRLVFCFFLVGLLVVFVCLFAFLKALNTTPATQRPGPGQMLEQPFPQQLVF